MQHRVTGTTMPVLEFALDPNDSIISEAGELSWMGASIQMTTHTQLGGGGGIFGAIKRVAGGGSLFMTEYRAVGAPGELAFATRVPGHIMPVDIAQTGDIMVHRHGFLCGHAPDLYLILLSRSDTGLCVKFVFSGIRQPISAKTKHSEKDTLFVYPSTQSYLLKILVVSLVSFRAGFHIRAQQSLPS